MWKTLDEKTLKSKKVVELREIAKTFGLQGYEKMKKADQRKRYLCGSGSDPAFQFKDR